MSRLVSALLICVGAAIFALALVIPGDQLVMSALGGLLIGLGIAEVPS